MPSSLYLRRQGICTTIHARARGKRGGAPPCCWPWPWEARATLPPHPGWTKALGVKARHRIQQELRPPAAHLRRPALRGAAVPGLHLHWLTQQHERLDQYSRPHHLQSLQRLPEASQRRKQCHRLSDNLRRRNAMAEQDRSGASTDLACEGVRKHSPRAVQPVPQESARSR